MLKTVLIIAVTGIAIGVGFAAVTGKFTSTNSKLLTACMTAITDREQSPKSVELYSSTKPEIRPATFDEYMGWGDESGKKKRDAALAEAEPVYAELMQIKVETFAAVPQTVAKIGIMFLADDPRGFQIRRGARCAVTWPTDEQPLDDTYGTIIRVNGLTHNEWHDDRIERLMNDLKG